jgi:hypothetical protein
MLSFESAGQVDVLHEHVARIHAVAVTWVGTAATAAAEIARVVVAIAGIVTPPSIEHRAPPSDMPAFPLSRWRPTELPVQFVAGP